MAQSQEVITEDDIPSLDLDDIKQTNREFEIDADELEFPSLSHHMTVRGKLEALVDHGAITWQECDAVYQRWKESKD